MMPIRAETVLIHPFIGERERLDTLYAEYESGSQIYRDKIRFLQQHYRGWRRSRGDGNCFLRSFLFNHLENIILLRDTAERDRYDTCALASSIESLLPSAPRKLIPPRLTVCSSQQSSCLS